MSVPVESGAPHYVHNHQLVISVAVATLLLATVDLLFACSYWHTLFGVPASRVMQNVAAGLLGKRAFLGGGNTVAMGVLLNYGIMAVMVSVYYVVARRVAALVQRPWLCGALYGATLYIVMNLIVVPLSAVPKPPVVVSWIVSSIVLHLIIGIAIAFSARRVSHSLGYPGSSAG
jgi:uncharacterized membrane protein YagU involved in acid resistance